MAAVGALVEGTALRIDEIAEQAGVGEATVGRWARRFGWRVAKSRETGARPCLGRYGPADHEAARLLIEGSRLGLEQVGLRLGIGTATLFRWRKRFRWRRPDPPDNGRPCFARYRTRRGRPYAADAVGIAQRLATASLLPQAAIACQAGVSQATVTKWIRRRGWARPDPGRRIGRFVCSRRTAEIATSGDRRGRPYGRDVVAEAGRLYRQTRLPTAIIGARVRVSAVTVARWAGREGWTRPVD